MFGIMEIIIIFLKGQTRREKCEWSQELGEVEI